MFNRRLLNFGFIGFVLVGIAACGSKDKTESITMTQATGVERADLFSLDFPGRTGDSVYFKNIPQGTYQMDELHVKIENCIDFSISASRYRVSNNDFIEASKNPDFERSKDSEFILDAKLNIPVALRSAAQVQFLTEDEDGENLLRFYYVGHVWPEGSESARPLDGELNKNAQGGEKLHEVFVHDETPFDHQKGSEVVEVDVNNLTTSAVVEISGQDVIIYYKHWVNGSKKIIAKVVYLKI